VFVLEWVRVEVNVGRNVRVLVDVCEYVDVVVVVRDEVLVITRMHTGTNELPYHTSWQAVPEAQTGGLFEHGRARNGMPDAADDESLAVVRFVIVPVIN
jgi:hypothetical protein